MDAKTNNDRGTEIANFLAKHAPRLEKGGTERVIGGMTIHRHEDTIYPDGEVKQWYQLTWPGNSYSGKIKLFHSFSDASDAAMKWFDDELEA